MWPSCLLRQAAYLNCGCIEFLWVSFRPFPFLWAKFPRFWHFVRASKKYEVIDVPFNGFIIPISSLKWKLPRVNQWSKAPKILGKVKLIGTFRCHMRHSNGWKPFLLKLCFSRHPSLFSSISHVNSTITNTKSLRSCLHESNWITCDNAMDGKRQRPAERTERKRSNNKVLPVRTMVTNSCS